MKTCPFCQKTIKDNAQKCQFCGGWFTDNAEEKQKVLNREEQARKLLKPQKDKAGEQLGKDALYFSVSAKKMVVMSLVTFGFYELYWFYRNWRTIKIEKNEDVSPFWRTVFSVLFCFSLFKRIIGEAVEREYPHKSSPELLALIYVILVLVASRAPSPFDMIGIFSFLPILSVNRAARFQNRAVDPPYEERQPLTGGEIAFIVVGVIIWVLNILALLFPEKNL